MLLLVDDRYNRLKEKKPVPTFVLTKVGTPHIDLQSFLTKYEDSKPYHYYIRNLKGKVLSELLANHRKEFYCMYSMIDSGQIDEYGYLIAEEMKKLRPNKN